MAKTIKQAVKDAEDEFVAEVWGQITYASVVGLDPAEERKHVAALFHKGFTVEEAVRYARNWEEVNPELDEDTACAAMSAIDDEVAARLEREYETEVTRAGR